MIDVRGSHLLLGIDPELLVSPDHDKTDSKFTREHTSDNKAQRFRGANIINFSVKRFRKIFDQRVDSFAVRIQGEQVSFGALPFDGQIADLFFKLLNIHSHGKSSVVA